MRIYVPKGWRCDGRRWHMMIHYCRGYPSWIQEVNDIRLEYRAAGGGSGTSGGDSASEVERKVERMEKLQENITTVERCCREATQHRPYMYSSLLMSVTTATPQDHLNMPVSRQQLSKYRKNFFFLLDSELTKRGVL